MPLFVLTGGPCSGKSTTIDELERRGHAVIREAAREVILEGKLHPSRDPAAFQREVLRRQVSEERGEGGGLVFADRGVGDHFGYIARFRAARGIEMPREFLADLDAAWNEARGRYAAVFLLAQNPVFSRAAYRDETIEEARAVHEALAAAWRLRHRKVIDIAWMPIGDRADRILAEAGALASGRTNDGRRRG